MSDDESFGSDGDIEDFGDGDGSGGGGNSVVGACALLVMGIGIFIFSILFLGWNEKNFVCENNHIMYADLHAEPTGCSSKGLDNAFVFFSCPLMPTTLETFSMCTFNRQNIMNCAEQPPVQFLAVSGKQVVEMVQCVESCETHKSKSSLGKNVQKTTCHYELQWSQTWINDKAFRHGMQGASHGCPDLMQSGGNPISPYNLDMGESEAWATEVRAGDANFSYMLNEGLVKQLTPDTPVSLKEFAAGFTGGVAAQTPTTLAPATVPGLPTTAPTAVPGPWTRPLKVSASNLMVQGDYLMTCQSLILGCVRISYFQSSATNPSVMTKVASGGATEKEDFPSSWGCAAEKWQAIVAQQMEKGEMIDKLLEDNRTQVWVFRLVGLCLCWLAVWCCFQPVSAAAGMVGDCVNMLPCGGYIDDFLTGLVDSVICVLSCSIGCSTGLFVIAVVWFYMRPLIGGALMAVCVLLCAFAGFMRCMATKRKKPGKALLGPGGGRGCPVDPNVARGFIEAARAEYVYNAPEAMQGFFDQGVSPQDQSVLAHFEDHIRDAKDPQQVISKLQAKWGV